jgi:hypothetical protein
MGGDPNQEICPLEKEICFDGCLGVEPRKVGVALAERLWDWRGNHFTEGLRDWGERALPL